MQALPAMGPADVEAERVLMKEICEETTNPPLLEVSTSSYYLFIYIILFSVFFLRV